MAYQATVIADSIEPHGSRLTTVTVTFPRIVLAEWNTHRVFSRNAASSRAIPISRMIKRVEEDPFLPENFGRNQPGMQALYSLEGEAHEKANTVWWQALKGALERARELQDLEAHKQLANRLLEPFSWVTVITTSTYWKNFFAQRCHEDAQPEIRKAAELVRDAIKASFPAYLEAGDWHLPFLQDSELGLPIEEKRKLCVARCARVSYLNHEGKRDLDADYKLYDRLINGTHWSPFEHIAMVCKLLDPPYNTQHGNFSSYWVQFRKTFPGENREG